MTIHYYVIVCNEKYYMDDECWDELTTQLRYATFFGSFAKVMERIVTLKDSSNNDVIKTGSLTIQKVSMTTEDLFDDQEKTS